MSEKLWIGGLVVGPIGTNCYILRDGVSSAEAVLVDPGDDPDKILKTLADLHTSPAAILLTHGHFDHILAVNEIRAAYPRCRVYIAEAERPMVEDRALNCNFFEGDYAISPDEYVSDGDEIGLLGRTFRVIATPGHTAGSVCYYSEADGVLFAGDTIFFESHGRVDLPTGRYDALRQSLERVLTSLPGETVILPGHGRDTTVSHERIVEGIDP